MQREKKTCLLTATFLLNVTVRRATLLIHEDHTVRFVFYLSDKLLNTHIVGISFFTDVEELNILAENTIKHKLFSRKCGLTVL